MTTKGGKGSKRTEADSTETGVKGREATEATETGPQRGDVVSVGYADPEKAARHRKGMADALKQGVPPSPLCPVPDDDERVAVRLDDHPYTFVVRVRAGRTGPVVTHLEVTADDGTEVDYTALRSIPLRRIKLSAWNWLRRFGGTIHTVDENELSDRRPDDPDAGRLYELVWRIEAAIMNGEQVRKTVAAEMRLSTATIDRMIRKAKDAGLMEGIEIPKRPGTRQSDIAQRDYLLGEHLGTYGPHSDAPFDDELADVVDRIAERERSTKNDTTAETTNDTGTTEKDGNR